MSDTSHIRSNLTLIKMYPTGLPSTVAPLMEEPRVNAMMHIRTPSNEPFVRFCKMYC
jgi:hypothetical protein